nr:DUF4198 domain-containing protein [Rhizobium halophytocola]
MLSLALLIPPAPLVAHDFWIEPSSFAPKGGTAVSVDLRFGQQFAGEPVPRNSATIDRFKLMDGAGGSREIAGADGLTPAGTIVADDRRTQEIVFDGGGGKVQMQADPFEAYLLAYGLEWVIDYRALQGKMRSPGREIFHRHAKALLTGIAASPVATEASDQQLELVPDSDPTQERRPGLRGRVLWNGTPLAGCLVIARNRATPKSALRVRSDRDGRFNLPLAGGVWLLQSVWMQRAGWFSAHDWESHWASLTFLKPGP